MGCERPADLLVEVELAETQDGANDKKSIALIRLQAGNELLHEMLEKVSRSQWLLWRDDDVDQFCPRPCVWNFNSFAQHNYLWIFFERLSHNRELAHGRFSHGIPPHFALMRSRQFFWIYLDFKPIYHIEHKKSRATAFVCASRPCCFCLAELPVHQTSRVEPASKEGYPSSRLRRSLSFTPAAVRRSSQRFCPGIPLGFCTYLVLMSFLRTRALAAASTSPGLQAARPFKIVRSS